MCSFLHLLLKASNSTHLEKSLIFLNNQTNQNILRSGMFIGGFLVVFFFSSIDVVNLGPGGKKPIKLNKDIEKRISVL